MACTARRLWLGGSATLNVAVGHRFCMLGVSMRILFALFGLGSVVWLSLGQVGLSRGLVNEMKGRGFVRYSEFGAKGDGRTDDLQAIVAAHAFANREGLSVKADAGAKYYIGGTALTAVIQTDTDFGAAEFIVDDRSVEDREASVFRVTSQLKVFRPKGIDSLKRGQEKVEVSLPGPCLITVTDANVRRYIRFGLNQNNGSPQNDIFVVDEKGNVDTDSPIVWDFDKVTDISALPIDETTLTISGGRFTTIANQAESKYRYYSRNVEIRRSNVVVDGMEHWIVDEGDQGAPYRGFISIRDCAYVTVRNALMTGHKTYETIGAAGKPVKMGTYDLSVNRALNVSFVNCRQTNDIDDAAYWGIMASNYSKNLLYDGCVLSRFDAHMGVANATIRNSTLGHMGINAIGSGTFLVENSTIRGRRFINLRSDYGSTWEGEFIIRDCNFVPAGSRSTRYSLINGFNSGKHNFGYTCYMPERILVDGLYIDDSNHQKGYEGPAIFADFNPRMKDGSYVEDFPYVRTKEVVLKRVSTASGMPLRLSDNGFMFKDVKVIEE
ncbi:MAG: hypothetical protein AAGB46_02945 [Verrucomicrobiota bacterium]